MTVSTRNEVNERGRRIGLLFMLCLSAACGGAGDATYPGLGYGATGGSGGRSAGTGGGAGLGGEAGTEAGIHPYDAGPALGDTGADSGPILQSPGLCSPDAHWAPLDRIESIAPANFARLGGVSGDELSLAFTSPTGDAYVADRSSPGAAFDPPVLVNDSSTRLAVDRIALGPTGMAMIAIAADRHSFLGFERTDRGQVWAPTAGLEFTQVRMLPEGGAEISNPVFGGDKRSLFFILTSYGKASLYESRWDMVQRGWGAPAKLANPELDSPDLAHLRRPTGASADGHTLFFFDEVSSLERGAWRDSATSPFVFFADVGSFAEATPSSACDTLYHQRVDDTGIRVFLAD
jgi:hypothetical protein